MSDVVKSVDIVFIYIIGVSLLLLLFITGIMIYFAIRYRQSKNPIPSDIRDNWKLEITWTIVPLLIAVSMFYFGWESYLRLRDVPPGALEIKVIGVQFAWIFEYPDNKKVSNDLLMVPQGKPIKLTITSEDVIHSLYIPAYRIKKDAVPGLNSYTWFYADKIGTYNIFCAEFCGVGHADMTATLRVVPEEEYLQWLEKE